MSYIEDGQPAGFDIEIIDIISERLDKAAAVRPAEWPEVLKMLEQSEIDAASGIILTPARTQFFDFTIPYLTQYYTIFIGKGSSLTKMMELEGRRLAVPAGEAVIETFVMPNGFQKNMTVTSSWEETFSLIEDGSADFTIAPYSIGGTVENASRLRELNDFRRSLITVEYRFAVRKGNSELLFSLNEILLKLKEEGLVDEIYSRTGFPRQFSPSTPKSRGSVFITTSISLVIVLMVLMVYYLSRKDGLDKAAAVESELGFVEQVLDNIPVSILWKRAADEPGRYKSFCRGNETILSALEDAVDSVSRSGKPSSAYVQKDSEENGEWAKITSTPLRDENGDLLGALGLAEDCSEQRRLSALVKELSTEITFRDSEIEQLRISDYATNLYNFGYMKAKLAEETDLCLSHGQKFCLLELIVEDVPKNMLSSGDLEDYDLLKRVSVFIKRLLRHSDIAAHNGCGIFLVIMPKTELDKAEAVADRIMQEFAEIFEGYCPKLSVWELPSELSGALPGRLRRLLDRKQESVIGE